MDILIEKYTDEEGIEVSIVKDDDGNIFHCWDLVVPEETAISVRKTAKELGIEEWEVVNMILEDYLNKHK